MLLSLIETIEKYYEMSIEELVELFIIMLFVVYILGFSAVAVIEQTEPLKEDKKEK